MSDYLPDVIKSVVLLYVPNGVFVKAWWDIGKNCMTVGMWLPLNDVNIITEFTLADDELEASDLPLTIRKRTEAGVGAILSAKRA